MADFYLISFACNDLHGRCVNKAQSVEVSSGDGMELELYGARPVTVRFNASQCAPRVHVGRRIFDVYGLHFHVGNLAWNGVDVDIDDAREIVSYLLGRGWTIEAASNDAQADLVNGGEHGR